MFLKLATNQLDRQQHRTLIAAVAIVIGLCAMALLDALFNLIGMVNMDEFSEALLGLPQDADN